MLNSSNHFATLAIFSAGAFPFLRRRYVSTVGFRSAFCAKYLDIVGSLNRGSVLLTIVIAWISSYVVATAARSGISQSNLTFADDCGCLDFIRRRHFSTFSDLLQIEPRVADDWSYLYSSFAWEVLFAAITCACVVFAIGMLLVCSLFL